MCETCGVTEEQYDQARAVAHICCVVSYYQDNGIDPSLYGYQRPGAAMIQSASDRIQRYHDAHPERGRTRDELAAEFTART